MFDRTWFRILLLAGIVAPLTSCTTSPGLTSIEITPTNPTVGLVLTADGGAAPVSDQLKTQFTAIGFYTHPGHPAIQRDITSQVKWGTDSPDLVTISTSGLALPATIAIGFGGVYASMDGFNGDIVSNIATYTVDVPSGSASSAEVISIAIKVPDQTSSVNSSQNFRAIGTAGNGDEMDITSKCTWSSSNTSVATVNAKTGVVTAVGSGQANVSVMFKNQGGLGVTGFATVTVK